MYGKLGKVQYNVQYLGWLWIEGMDAVKSSCGVEWSGVQSVRRIEMVVR